MILNMYRDIMCSRLIKSKQKKIIFIFKNSEFVRCKVGPQQQVIAVK